VSKTRNLSDLLDANGDVKSTALDNVPASDLVNDTTPQLGGTLDTNGNPIQFGDNDKAQFGASQDLSIYHDGSHSYIEENGVGGLFIRGTDYIVLENSNGNEDYVKCFANGAVELYHDNSKKIETSSTGATVTGTLTATAFSGDGSALTNISAGKVGQLVQSRYTGTASTGSTSFVSTGHSVTITPSATNSKVFIMLQGGRAQQAGNDDMIFGLWRGSTQLVSLWGSHMDVYSLACGHSGAYLDSPSTTSATTYTIYMRKTNGGVGNMSYNSTIVGITPGIVLSAWEILA